MIGRNWLQLGIVTDIIDEYLVSKQLDREAVRHEKVPCFIVIGDNLYFFFINFIYFTMIKFGDIVDIKSQLIILLGLYYKFKVTLSYPWGLEVLNTRDPQQA